MRTALTEVHRRMARDHGLIRRTDALHVCGMTPGQVDGLVRGGHWEAAARGVYRCAGSARPPEQALLAAVWRSGPGALLTAGPVLGLLGVEGFDRALEPVVLVDRRRRVRGVRFEVRYRRGVPRRHQAVVSGIPAVTPHRALIDLAERVSERDLRVAIDAARRRGRTSPRRLRDTAEDALPHRGARRILRLADRGTMDQESEGERGLAAVFADHEPPLEFQAWLLEGIRVDAVWRDARLVLEYDGRAHHTLPTDREHDRWRRARLRAAGWEVIVVTAELLAAPDELRALVLRRRRERLAELAGA